MNTIETLRSFVNTWECDENDHLNIQFYFDRFDIAGVHFLARTGTDRQVLGPRALRHVRYHSEMVSGESIQCHSAFVAGRPGQIVHFMSEPETGRLTATALDTHLPTRQTASHSGDLPIVEPEANYQPRSIPGAFQMISETEDTLLASGGLVTNCSIIHPMHCDVHGQILDQFIVSHFTDGAAQAWGKLGLTKHRTSTDNLGRVAVEMKLTIYDRPPPDTVTQMITSYTGWAAKTISFRHHIFDVQTGGLFAICDATALLVDLNTRKSVPLPDFVQQAFSDMGLK